MKTNLRFALSKTDVNFRSSNLSLANRYRCFIFAGGGPEPWKQDL